MNQITTLNDNYADNKIESVNVLLVESMTGAELEYDVLDARIDPTTRNPTVFMPSDYDGIKTEDGSIFGCRPYFSVLASDPKQYKYGREVLYYHDGDLIGKFYMQKCLRVKKHLYSISCVSAIGLLGKSKHYGGLYTGADTFATVVQDVIGGLVKYSIDEAISSQRVYGWLPIATRRENLHQLMFAMGATIKKDENGDMFITMLSSSTSTDIPDSRIYVGGSVEYPGVVTKVSVLEHAYLNKGTADEQTTLFEGSVVLPESPFISPKGETLTGMVVEFSEPIHNLVIAPESAEQERGVNYAIVNATGSVTVTGYKYTHTTVERFKGDADADEDNTVTVTEATLVSRANSSNVVDRLYSYYTSAKTIKMDIVATGERAGDAVSFNDPYDEATSGLISELSLVGSNILKGSATIIADYAPTWGNDYTDVIIVTSSQKVTLPNDANKCRVVLISGGHGGGRGGKGGTGETANGAYGKGGAGGAGGAAGSGGRITESFIGENCGGISLDCVIGKGGAGGTASNPNGSGGTDSTISYTKDGELINLTTENGTPSFSGFQNFLNTTDPVYGAYGADGQAGAKGGGSDGAAGSVIYNGITYTGGTKKDYSQSEEGGQFEGWLIYNELWTDNIPAIYLSVRCKASNGNVTFNVSVDKPSDKYYEYYMYIKVTLGGQSETVVLQGDRSTKWKTLEEPPFTISGSGWCTIEMWASGGDRTEPVVMGSGNIPDSKPFTRTYNYGYGSGAVVAKKGVNGGASTDDLSGADGVSATVVGANASVRGSGGSGGNGGSGGGAGGYYHDSDDGGVYNYGGGVGGNPTNGGNGADGIILIYYGTDAS